jgi:glycosyltransferase involved in cell wall biosynthesis
MTSTQVHLILAPKERFEPAGAGAFALNALETSLASRWRHRITVFGSPVAHPFPSIQFRPLNVSRWPLRGRNVAMAQIYANAVRGALPGLVEIFNRPIMVKHLTRKLWPVPLLLHFGNDPRGMDGSRSVGERRNLLTSTAAIVCVSNFIRTCFLDGLDEESCHGVHVVHTGVTTRAGFPIAKQKSIVFVGRLVPEKGVLELVRALARVLPHHPDWSAQIIGARWFGTGGKPDSFEREVSCTASGCDRIVIGGFRTHEEVVAALERASIAVVPSKWDDPFPRTALEALAAGCALVCSRRGGLPEIGATRAVFLDDVSVQSLTAALEALISSEPQREALQHRGRANFPFDIIRTTGHLDDIRGRLLGKPGAGRVFEREAGSSPL